jgi:hypothetical protein
LTVFYETDGPNLYAYIKNNPTCCVDRFGLFMDNCNFSTSWSSFKSNCSWLGSQAADYTFNNTRFQGAMRAFGGIAECTSGATLATGGTMASGGCLAAVAVPAGWCMIAHGGDNFIAGCNQFITSQEHKPLTVQLLEKAGMSHETSSLTNDVVCFGGAAIGAAACTRGPHLTTSAYNGAKSTLIPSRGAENVNAAESLARKFTQ